MSFNDLFEYLYQQQTQQYFNAAPHPCPQGSLNRYLPPEVFEPVLMAYFQLDREVLRRQAFYDERLNGYPRQELSCLNHDDYASLLPDVRSYTEHDDGTATMIVDVICSAEETDSLFIHELTVRNLSEGTFQYVSNRIIAFDEECFPYLLLPPGHIARGIAAKYKKSRFNQMITSH